MSPRSVRAATTRTPTGRSTRWPGCRGTCVEEAGRIWLVRGCPRHGRVTTLYDESPEILRYLEEWTAPTKAHVPDVDGNFDPIPSGYLHGLR